MRRALPILASGLAGCGWLAPPSASTAAPRIDAIFYALLGFSGLITLLIAGLILYYIIRYREGRRGVRPPQRQQKWKLEAVWAGVLTVIALAIFFWAGYAYLQITSPPKNARLVYVVGKQWMWKFQHENGRREINELHIPVGEPIRLLLFSEDVVHSFFVPAFRLKQDAVPGRYTSLWFVATKPGKYLIQCAEYCGAEHALMRGFLYAMTPRDFQAWISGGAPGPAPAPVPGTPGAGAPLAVRGKGPFFQLGCNSCHLPTAAVRAPRLDGLYGSQVRLRNEQAVIADEQYLRESILDPNAKIVAGYDAPSLMPTYQGIVSEEQLRQLIEFIKSIKTGWPKEALP